jgi:hypothetical protein
MRQTIPIMTAGDENSQWSAWNGLLRESSLWSNSLALKVPETVDLI